MSASLHDHLIRSLRALCEREGGYAAVAAASGCNAQTLYQIVKGVQLPSGKPKGVGRALEDKLNRAFPGWSSHPLMGDKSAQTPHNWGADSRGRIAPLAHQLSLGEPSIRPIENLPWETLVTMRPLPPRFRVTLPDDAMAVDDPPSMRAGDWAEFLSQSVAAPNQVVLLADRDGNVFVRRFTARRPGHWIAAARNSGFEPLDSIRDGLTVLAVQVASGWG